MNKKVHLSTIVTALSIGAMLLIFVIVLAQIRGLSEEIKAQTDINQRFLRCILLLEREKFNNPESRLVAIDTCAIESKTPSGSTPTAAPTNQDREDFEEGQQSTAPQSQNEQSEPQTQPNAAPAQPQPVQPQVAPPAPPEQSLVQSIVTPVTNFVKELL